MMSDLFIRNVEPERLQVKFLRLLRVVKIKLDTDESHPVTQFGVQALLPHTLRVY